MNKFATITEEIRFNKVTYYSIRVEGTPQSMFLEFINRIAQDKTLEDDLALIRSWLTKLGNTYGALEHFFRFENAANALPPPLRYIEVESNLRLYCMRINDNAVILFSGAVKTKKTAQQCPNVKPYFNMANIICRKIDKAIIEKDIQIDHETGILLIDKDFTIEL